MFATFTTSPIFTKLSVLYTTTQNCTQLYTTCQNFTIICTNPHIHNSTNTTQDCAQLTRLLQMKTKSFTKLNKTLEDYTHPYTISHSSTLFTTLHKSFCNFKTNCTILHNNILHFAQLYTTSVHKSFHTCTQLLKQQRTLFTNTQLYNTFQIFYNGLTQLQQGHNLQHFYTSSHTNHNLCTKTIHNSTTYYTTLRDFFHNFIQPYNFRTLYTTFTRLFQILHDFSTLYTTLHNSTHKTAQVYKHFTHLSKHNYTQLLHTQTLHNLTNFTTLYSTLQHFTTLYIHFQTFAENTTLKTIESLHDFQNNSTNFTKL